MLQGSHVLMDEAGAEAQPQPSLLSASYLGRCDCPSLAFPAKTRSHHYSQVLLSKALNSRKPVLSLSHQTEPFIPANWIHKNAPKIQPSVFHCFLRPVQMNKLAASVKLQYHLQYHQLNSKTTNTPQWFNFHNHSTL